ncbi:ABC transporter permease [Aquimarina algicola]|uniref:FtsX-like permease family protein n=1 Tax=Aquimarina algicola TaxID=2589995 RepID=A0A504JMS4_9FLAO|nr:ABC transporter permease [Aquimarina algicola]TPN88011.1 FtsX-like permease family protein [Aquimarina algicola]
MFKNYIKIAWRNLLKNKVFSMINIFGLAIGITCASLIFLWVEDELNFNSVFEKEDQVYYVPTNQRYEGEWRTFFRSTPGPLAEDMKNEIPGIIRSVRTTKSEFLFKVNENSITKTGRHADHDIFEIFGLSFIEGNAQEAFANPEAIVLSRKTADQLFGENTKALGKVIKVNNLDNYVVTGVIENLPENVTYTFDWIAPFERYAIGKEWMTEYGSNFADTFVELSPEADFGTVDAKVRQIMQEKDEGNDTYAFLHSMKDWHLRDNFEGGKRVGGRILYVRLFSIIAFIILLIACINFMNLATARSEKRANEVGVRKALGSGRKKIIVQFIFEALLMTTMATGVSIIFLLILLPHFNILIEKNLTLGILEPLHIGFLFVITIVCGFLAGVYPAFYLSSFKPLEVLKGIKVTHGGASLIRKGLVIGQFTVSIVFIISTILVYQQIQHVKSRSLGYDKENLITMRVKGDMVKNFTAIKHDMINSGMITNVALNSYETLSAGNNGSGVHWDGIDPESDLLVSYRYITPEFLSTAGMEIINGRDFYTNSLADTTKVVITKSLAQLIDQNNVVGKMIGSRGKQREIIGVINDYVYGDMYGTSDPVIFFFDPEQENKRFSYRNMYVKSKSGADITQVLLTMKDIMYRHNPAFPFEYSFVDDSFHSKFKSEMLVGKLSRVFAILAIILSCLGLFGLAAYTAEQRNKEIGIRKVLGASVFGVVRLLSKEFIRLVFLAILIAIPLAWLMMQYWLENFAYRIEINWTIFLLAGVIAIGIALITVSFQAIKAATSNPVDSLRTE